MDIIRAIEQGRSDFAARRWNDAYDRLYAVHERARLDPDDLDRLAAAAYLTGRDSGAIDVWTALYRACVEADACDRGAIACFWLGFVHLLAGEMAPGSGWLARANRLLDQHGAECVAHGYVAVLNGLRTLGGGDAAAARTEFARAVSCSRRFADDDLLALGLLGEGQALASDHKTGEGTMRLDEAMVGVSTGVVSPVLAGIVYCAVILTCQRIFDVRRAREWTSELNDWCAAQPDLVPFRGQCLVHRSEILQFQGDWPGARDEASNACRNLGHRRGSIAGRAFYQRGEICRLCGEFDEAERMYREASLHGRDPQPGAALLLLARGRAEAAAAAMASVIDTASNAQMPGGGDHMPLILGPYVEILLTTGQIERARDAAANLAACAEAAAAPLLDAWAAQTRGLVLLAEGDCIEALGCLRTAWMLWQQLECPYEAARVRVWLADASDRSGDPESAHHHRAEARAIFERLGALPDLKALDEKTPETGSDGLFGLSVREREILALVAEGATNRQIADALSISRHTVARHLSNIFDKLGVTTRTAAGAFAHTHDLAGTANSQN